MKSLRISAGLVACLVLAGASSPALAVPSVWWGGSIGFGSGDVDYYAIEPLIGVSLTSRLSVGGSVFYRYRKDDRYDESYRSSDVGTTLFGRYVIQSPLFLHAEYETVRYTYKPASGGTERDEFSSVLGGAGISFPAGGRASIFALALYNFSYDEDELRTPYDSPWVYRGGVTIGF